MEIKAIRSTGVHAKQCFDLSLISFFRRADIDSSPFSAAYMCVSELG